jgi:metal-responsive CopG/Arc/MetJ family transcriptional regulator
MSVKTFNVSFPRQLADEIDKATQAQFGSRSDFLRAAAIKYLREEREWEELLVYGKEIGKATGYQTEAAVAADITAQRREREDWRQNAAKRSH